MEAVSKNNASRIEANDEKPDRGGNVEAYKLIVGEEKPIACEEYTMCQWESTSAEELIATQLIEDWARSGELARTSPIVNQEVSHVGISNKAHKKCVNLI